MTFLHLCGPEPVTFCCVAFRVRIRTYVSAFSPMYRVPGRSWNPFEPTGPRSPRCLTKVGKAVVTIRKTWPNDSKGKANDLLTKNLPTYRRHSRQACLSQEGDTAPKERAPVNSSQGFKEEVLTVISKSSVTSRNRARLCGRTAQYLCL